MRFMVVMSVHKNFFLAIISVICLSVGNNLFSIIPNTQEIYTIPQPYAPYPGGTATETTRYNSVSWQEISGTHYLALAGAMYDVVNGVGIVSGPTLWVYKFVQDVYGNRRLDLVTSYTLPANTFGVAWQEIDGEYYLIATTNYANPVANQVPISQSISLFRFDYAYTTPALELLQTITYAPSPPFSVANLGGPIAWKVIGSDVYAMIQGDNGGIIGLAVLYKFNKTTKQLDLQTSTTMTGAGTFNLRNGQACQFLSWPFDGSLNVSLGSLDWIEINGRYYIVQPARCRTAPDIYGNVRYGQFIVSEVVFNEPYSAPQIIPVALGESPYPSVSALTAAARWITINNQAYIIGGYTAAVGYATYIWQFNPEGSASTQIVSHGSYASRSLGQADWSIDITEIDGITYVLFAGFSDANIGPVSQLKLFALNVDAYGIPQLQILSYSGFDPDQLIRTVYSALFTRINNIPYIGAGAGQSTLATPSQGAASLFQLATTDTNLVVSKSAYPSIAHVGDTVTFTVFVGNAGPSLAPAVTAYDSLPSGITLVSAIPSQGSYNSNTGVWDIGILAAGASASLTITATVNIGQENKTITNTVSAFDAYAGDPYTNNNTASASVVIRPYADLAIAKSVDNLTPIDGSVVTFSIGVTNNGAASVAQASVLDILPAGLTYISSAASQGSYDNSIGIWSIGNLAVGQSETLMIAVQVGPNAPRVIVNTAQVFDAYTDDPYSLNNSAQATIIVTPVADLSITKTVNNMYPAVEENVTYTITVTNSGPDNVSAAQVVDLLPTGLFFVSSSASQGSYDPITGLWTIGNINVGGSATLSIIALVDISLAGQTVVNTATVSDPYVSDVYQVHNAASATIFVKPLADLSITKLVDNTNPAVGEVVTYTIIVTNAGPDTAFDISVVDQLPAGVSYVASAPSQGTYNPSTGIWGVGALANGASATLLLSASINFSAAGQTIVNTATVLDAYTPDIYSGGNTAQASLTVKQDAELVITKQVSEPRPIVGQVITYTVTVTNRGPNTALSVIVNDLLPVGLAYVSSSPSQGTYDQLTGEWTVGSISNGASATMLLFAQVAAGTESQTITNTATVFDAYVGDIYSGNNSASASITVIPATNLSITKTVDYPNPKVGDMITFSLHVANLGPTVALDVMVSDVLPTGLSYLSSTASQGSYSVLDGTWTIGTLAASSTATLQIVASVDLSAAGQTITNTATVFDPYTGDPYRENNTASATLVVQANANLVVTKAASPQSPISDQPFSYTITVTNYGPNTAPAVQVYDVIPVLLTYLSSSASQGSYDYASGLWSVGTLVNGASATLTITVQGSAALIGATITNTATAFDAYIGDIYAGGSSSSTPITILGNSVLADSWLTWHICAPLSDPNGTIHVQ